MATLQCCCCSPSPSPATSSSSSSSHRSFPPLLQESRGIFRREVGTSSANSQDGSLPLPACGWSSGRAAAAAHVPLRSTGRWQSRSQNLCLAAAAGSPSSPAPDSSSSSPADASAVPAAEARLSNDEEKNPESLRQNWRTSAAELRAKVSKWGLAAVLAYGLFDGITYTTFFVLAFLSYEKSTGQNPAANLKALLGVVVLMWGGNNVTRPFRVAGAAAIAPFIDRGLKKMQQVLKLPNQAFAFMICVAAFACACLSVVAVLVLSRLGR